MDEAEMMRGRGAASALPRVLRVLLVLGFLVAAGATVLVVIAEDVRLLRLGAILALWAALIGAFAVTRSRRDVKTAAMRESEAHLAYQLELQREITARQEYETELTASMSAAQSEQIAELREQLDRLTEVLSSLADGELLVSRLTLSAESARFRAGQQLAAQTDAMQLGAEGPRGLSAGVVDAADSEYDAPRDEPVPAMPEADRAGPPVAEPASTPGPEPGPELIPAPEPEPVQAAEPVSASEREQKPAPEPEPAPVPEPISEPFVIPASVVADSPRRPEPLATPAAEPISAPRRSRHAASDEDEPAPWILAALRAASPEPAPMAAPIPASAGEVPAAAESTPAPVSEWARPAAQSLPGTAVPGPAYEPEPKTPTVPVPVPAASSGAPVTMPEPIARAADLVAQPPVAAEPIATPSQPEESAGAVSVEDLLASYGLVDGPRRRRRD